MKKRHILKVSALLSVVCLVLFALMGTTTSADGEISDKYYSVRTITLEDGTSIDEIVINGPPTPPPGYERPVAKIPDKGVKLLAVNTLSNVPAFDWSYGCSATSGAMIAGYYDGTGYANMYAGPTNGGVMPMDNSAWGYMAGECPLSATHQGYDGRTIRGHVDDYWVSYGSTAPDPFIGNWAEHTYGDCTGDYMKTSQYNYGNTDGSTTFWNYTNGAPLHWYDMSATIRANDGGYGLKLFYESRGYTVTDMYNQYILGYASPTQGFTYAQYKAEIDAGRPVMIHVAGHTMVGFGYDDATNLMYIHDTWDYSDHTMTWGGSYSGMQHYGVTIVQLAATEPSPSIDVYTDQASYSAGETQIFGMDLANPGSTQPVRLVLLLWTPFGVFPVIDVDFSLPTGNFPNPSLFQWTVLGIPTGSYYAWIGVLIPVDGDPSFDVAWWAFTGGASSQHTLPAEEVLKGLAEIDLNFDEYDSASSQGAMPVEQVLKELKGLDLNLGEWGVMK